MWIYQNIVFLSQGNFFSIHSAYHLTSQNNIKLCCRYLNFCFMWLIFLIKYPVFKFESRSLNSIIYFKLLEVTY